jgi:hypothetical protein
VENIELTCLANSRKLGGRCVAGVTQTGTWIRPVSEFADGTLYSSHYTMDNGVAAAVFDVVRVPVTAPRPEFYQPENWVVPQRGDWTYVRTLSQEEARAKLAGLAQTEPQLFGNESDRISVQAISSGATITESLAVVRPNSLRWWIGTSLRGNRQTRALFDLSGTSYSLGITDPAWETHLGGLGEGQHELDAVVGDEQREFFFTVSLGEPFNGDCYKLIAAVIALPPVLPKSASI